MGSAMSWSSGSSSAPGFRLASGRQGMDVRSSVPYRQGAMEYEPAKMCHCNPRRKAPRWISWSEMNPGRRYYACVDAMHGGCGFVEWHDPPLPKFFSDLIGDLRNEVRKLKGDGRLARAEDAFVSAFGDVHMAEDEAGENMIAMKNLQEQLKMKNAELDAIKKIYKSVLCVHYLCPWFGVREICSLMNLCPL
ncbi:hypothetical protein D1007_06819 [Hordeum vulgare]|nr:hypothetical protein D1007_06819 [Hordeum vulgare]